MSKKKEAQFTDNDFVVRAHEPEALADEQTTEETESAESLTVANGFVIEEQDIPKRSGKNTLHYPIGSLTAGSKQSFVVPAEPDKVKSVTSSVRTFAYRNGFKVTLRAEMGGVRVWRKA